MAERAKIGQMNRWTSISSDILEIIFEKVAFADKLNCGAVCSYWHCVAKSNLASRLSRLERPPPLLVLENLEPDYRWAVERESIKGSWFYCPKTKELLKLNDKSEQFKMSTCAGSSNGWLMFTQCGEKGRDQKLFLYNPHLDVGLRPPSQLTLPFGEHPLQNVILWGNPVSTDLTYNFSIVITTARSIAFARYGASNWTLLDSGNYIDVISSKNYVYSLTATCGVQAWDFSRSTPLKVLDIAPSLEEDFYRDEGHWTATLTLDIFPRQFYLVESNGELLIAARYQKSSYDPECGVTSIYPYFCLYYLDFVQLKWKRTLPFGHVYFLGKGQCASYPDRWYNYWEQGSINEGILFADDPKGLGQRYHIFGAKKRKIELPAFWLVS